MEVQQDFKNLLDLFNKHKIDYIVVGGGTHWVFMVLPGTQGTLTSL
jgi:2-hydroxy-3-keto-5-methylthiopentenyl-1-phosphate phosphatase